MAIICPKCRRQYDVTLFQFGRSLVCDCGAVVDPFKTAAVEIPVEGTLDLHTFKPSEVKDLLPEYLRVCIEKGIVRVRIIHGKGAGTLLRTVHSILKKTPEVVSFELAGPEEGGWGATIVRLKARP